MIKNGVHITKNGNIIVFENVKIYEDLKNVFAIVTYINEKGIFPKTLVTKKQFNHFYRLGPYK